MGTDITLTPKQQEIQQRARDFTRKYIIPAAREHDRTAEFPEFIVKKAIEAGIFPHSIPKKYNGPGYDILSQSLIAEELGYGCLSFANILTGNLLSSHLVLIGGSEEQKKFYLGQITSGGLGGFLLTESGAGSDAGSVKTTARLDGDAYVLNGSKCFASFCSYAKVMVVIASTDLTKGTKGLSAFILDRSHITVSKPEHKMGIRCSDSVEISFKNMRVPKENLIGNEGEGFKYAMMALDVARTTVASVALGCARRALDEAVKFCKERTDITGKPLYKHQSVAFKIADIAMQIEASRQLVNSIISLKESGLKFNTEAAMSKAFSTDTAMKACTVALKLMGSKGYSTDTVVEKLMRDIKIYQIFEGSNQVQRLVISRGVFNS